MKTSYPSFRDILFGAINGAIFGFMALFVVRNITTIFEETPFIFLFSLSVFGFAFLAGVGIVAGFFLSRIANFFFQLAKFGAVGASNFAIDFGVLNIFVFVFGITSGPFFWLFKALSFVVAVINSYFWNKYWSFEKTTKKQVSKEFFIFILISAVGLLLNTIVSGFFTDIVGIQGSTDPKVWANISAAIASVAVLAWNFIGYKFIVFKK